MFLLFAVAQTCLAVTPSFIAYQNSDVVYVYTWGSCSESSCNVGSQITSISFPSKAVVGTSISSSSLLMIGISGLNFVYSCTTTGCTMLASATTGTSITTGK